MQSANKLGECLRARNREGNGEGDGRMLVAGGRPEPAGATDVLPDGTSRAKARAPLSALLVEECQVVARDSDFHVPTRKLNLMLKWRVQLAAVEGRFLIDGRVRYTTEVL